MTDEILSAILKIRDSGKTNMCDYKSVQRLAFDAGMYSLVNYIEEDPARYFHFIVYGEEPAETSTSS